MWPKEHVSCQAQEGYQVLICAWISNAQFDWSLHSYHCPASPWLTKQKSTTHELLPDSPKLSGRVGTDKRAWQP